jgi:cysteate synthase
MMTAQKTVKSPDSRAHYHLSCLACGRRYADGEQGFLLACEQDHTPALLRAEYSARRLEIDDDQAGIFRYARWLPVRRALPGAQAPVVFHSRQLGPKLGLERLYIGFSGYWPEKNAFLSTCSFKELEALSICARIPDREERTLIISSAGNTGRAFLQIASEQGIKVCVVVPESALPAMWITTAQHPGVTLAVLQGGADYADAIHLASLLSALPECYPEGGARNVARRDGMGTVVLAAAEVMGEIPHHYVQAVGSGTGGIAAWEMSLRLLADGSFGGRTMRLHFVQNEPFTIMTEAWNDGSRQLPDLPAAEARERIGRLHSPVLSNRNPPYGVRGGVYDALTAGEGAMYAVSNSEARQAGALFMETEGCDLDPAAEVALAGLIQAVKRGAIAAGESVLFNATGGGYKRLAADRRSLRLDPDILFTPADLKNGAAAAKFRQRRRFPGTAAGG